MCTDRDRDKKIVIAIDGFSSCGKSTFAKAIARRLGYIFIATIDLFVLGFMSLLTKLSESLNKKQKRGFLLAFALIACISVLEVITIVVDGAPTGCRWLNILSNYLGFGLTPGNSL